MINKQTRVAAKFESKWYSLQGSEIEMAWTYDEKTEVMRRVHENQIPQEGEMAKNYL